MAALGFVRGSLDGGLRGGVDILSAAQALMKDTHCCKPWREN